MSTQRSSSIISPLGAIKSALTARLILKIVDDLFQVALANYSVDAT